MLQSYLCFSIDTEFFFFRLHCLTYIFLANNLISVQVLGNGVRAESYQNLILHIGRYLNVVK